MNTTRAFSVLKCQACGLAFVDPRPTTEELDAFYTSAYFNRPAGTTIGYQDYDGDSLATANSFRMWESLLTWEPALVHVGPKVLLDIGCATGTFAASMAAEGWAVSGVELAQSARESASTKGVSAVASIHDAPSGNGLITMFHVLEHVLDPLDTLEMARSLIARQGRLVIELPQWRSLGRIVKRERWSALTPPEHINFFDSRSLALALERSGWEVLKSSTVHTHGMDRAIEAVKQRHPARVAKYVAITELVERTGLAGSLRVVARPA